MEDKSDKVKIIGREIKSEVIVTIQARDDEYLNLGSAKKSCRIRGVFERFIGRINNAY